MYVCDNSSLKRFFQSIICQMYQSLILIKKYTLQERVKFGYVTDQITYWFIDREEKHSNTPS